MLAAQAAFEAEHGIKPSEHKMSNLLKRDHSLDSSDEFGVIGNGNGDNDGLDHHHKVVEANTIVSSQPNQLNQPVRPLPPFSPNFGRSSMQIANGNDESTMDDMKVGELIVSCLFTFLKM